MQNLKLFWIFSFSPPEPPKWPTVCTVGQIQGAGGENLETDFFKENLFFFLLFTILQSKKVIKILISDVHQHHPSTFTQAVVLGKGSKGGGVSEGRRNLV